MIVIAQYFHTEITINPKTNEPAVKVADKPDSFFHIRSIYFKK